MLLLKLVSVKWFSNQKSIALKKTNNIFFPEPIKKKTTEGTA